MQTSNSHLLLFKQKIFFWLYQVKTNSLNSWLLSWEIVIAKEVEKQKYLQSNFTPIIIFTCSAPPPMALITALSVLWFFYIHVMQNEFNGWYGRKIEMQMQFSTVKHHEWGSPKTIEEVDFSHLDTREGNAWFSPLKLLRMFTWLTWKRERILMMRGWNLWQEILTYKSSLVPRYNWYILTFFLISKI